MDATTVRMFTLAAAGALALGAADTALACDQCLKDTQHTNSGICWGGFPDGIYCTGGQADNTWCTNNGACSGDTANQSTQCDYNRWSGLTTIQSCS